MDWLEIEPSELLRRLRGCDYPPSKTNFFTKPKGNARHYWIELKKQLGGGGGAPSASYGNTYADWSGMTTSAIV